MLVAKDTFSLMPERAVGSVQGSILERAAPARDLLENRGSDLVWYVIYTL